LGVFGVTPVVVVDVASNVSRSVAVMAVMEFSVGWWQ